RAEVYKSDIFGRWLGWEAAYRWYVTIDDVPPTVPILLEPSDGVTTESQTPIFDWTDSTDSSGVDHYVINIYDKDITWGDIEETTQFSIYTPAAQIPRDRIFWKVQAFDVAGNMSESAESAFQIVEP